MLELSTVVAHLIADVASPPFRKPRDHCSNPYVLLSKGLCLRVMPSMCMVAFAFKQL